MKITYDKEIDALYIELQSTYAHHNIDITNQVSVDVTESGNIVGIEILDAQEVLKENLYDLEFHQFPLRDTASLHTLSPA
jgi:uncharacterized protein YuzE